jgi:hypothetical protein
MKTTTVRVAVTVDWEAAARHGYRMLAADFLCRFRQEGENWQREIQENEVMKELVRVAVVTEGDT